MEELRERVMQAARDFRELRPDLTIGELIVEALVAPERRGEEWVQSIARMPDVDAHMALKEALDYRMPIGKWRGDLREHALELVHAYWQRRLTKESWIPGQGRVPPDSNLTFGRVLLEAFFAPEEQEDPWAQDFVTMTDYDALAAFEDAASAERAKVRAE